MNNLEIVGKVTKSFGPDGGLLINLYDDFPETIDLEEPLYAMIDSLPVPLFFDSFKRHGQSGAEVRFADFDNEIRAAELVGAELYRQSAEEPDDDVVYLEDLVGFAVSFDDLPYHGTVSGYVDNDMNPLFEIDIDGKSVLIPAAEEMISELDIEEHRIEFSLPEGLIELYLD